MKRYSFIAILALIAICFLTGCDKNRGRAYAPSTPVDSTLIIYYSQNGATRAVAEELQFQLGCDIVEIKPVRPYDGDYDATLQRWKQELDDGGIISIETPDIDFGKYKNIFIGSPIWGNQCSLPIYSFIKDHYFVGKRLYTFCTSGSSGLDGMTQQIAEIQHDSAIIFGIDIKSEEIEKAPEIIHRYLVEQNLTQADQKE